MSFTYPLLLGGLLAVVIPVALHLLLRQKPKVVLFPAFRFLVQRSRTNLTKLRLRHFLLLALRVLLFALIVLALAQPKVRDNPWNLSSYQAVAAVFVFDTSASMDYTVGTSQTRLKEAQKRAVEMLQLLPANSEVVVLDTADAAPVGKSDWLSRETAAERIGQLKVQPANAPVTARLAVALRLFAKVAETRDEDERYKRARVLVVFSDRTRAAWDTQERRNLQTLANQVPPALERLAAVRGGVPELVKLLGESGQDEQPLIDRLQKLADLIPQLRPETYPDAETTALIGAIRSRQQELAALLQKQSTQSGSDKLLAALKASLRGTGGFTGFYVDVGVEQPHDTALLDFQLVRQFKDNALVHRLQVDVQQTGDDSEPGLVCEVDGAALPAPVELDDSGKPRKARTLVFDLAPEHLARGLHQAKVSLKTPDALANNNTRYLTYAVRPVLLLTDDPDGDEAKSWERAIQANQLGAALYRCDRKRPGDFEERGAGVFNEYAAVFLCGVKEPRPKLWELLKDHAESGRGLGVFPPVGE